MKLNIKKVVTSHTHQRKYIKFYKKDLKNHQCLMVEYRGWGRDIVLQ